MAVESRETTEVYQTNEAPAPQATRTVRTSRAGGSLMLYRIIWLIAGIIIALLALRVILLLLGANEAAPFVGFVYALSSVFAWPFYGIFGYTPHYGQSVLEISSIVAIIVYALIAWGLGKLATLTTSRTDI